MAVGGGLVQKRLTWKWPAGARGSLPIPETASERRRRRRRRGCKLALEVGYFESYFEDVLRLLVSLSGVEMGLGEYTSIR
jgi:hypothetical protein